MLKDHRDARSEASQRITGWPGDIYGGARYARNRNGGGLLGSRSEAHARQAWENARARAVSQAPGLLRECGYDHAVVLGLIDLAFCAALAQHLAGCRRCWDCGRWADDYPAEWLTWAVGTRRNLLRIMAPVLAEGGASRRTELPVGR